MLCLLTLYFICLQLIGLLGARVMVKVRNAQSKIVALWYTLKKEQIKCELIKTVFTELTYRVCFG